MPTTKKPLVSIIVLNWNRISDTLLCLESIRNISYKNKEIIVVDNGSVDDSKEILSNIKDIIYIDNPKNRGFTGGHIDGYKESNGKYILILNNDAVMSSDYLSIAVEQMENDKQIGALGGRAYSWDETQEAYDTSNKFYSYQNINPVTAEGIFEVSDFGKIQEVNNVSGSSALLRKSVIEEIGYFYEPFFAYYEETDLFARMKRYGFKIMYEPALHIWHKSGSSSSSYFQFNQLFKNRFIFAIRNFEGEKLPSFLKSYIRTGLQSTYMRFKNNDNEALHKGFSNAFIKNCFVWPKYIINRRKLQSRIGIKNNYNHDIVKDRTSISIVFDGTGLKTSELNSLIKGIYSNILNKNPPNIEVSLVVGDKLRYEGDINYVYVTSINKNKSLNLGWLSSRGEYIYFADSNIIDLKALLSEATSMKLLDKWISKSMPRLMSRELLIHKGGIEAANDDDSIDSLQLFSYFWSAKKTFLDKTDATKVQKKYSDEKTQEIQIQVNASKHEDKAPSRWSIFLAKHYRIYQQSLLVRWIFTREITNRLRLARIKNLIVFGCTFNRGLFAKELKHIRNTLFSVSFIGVDIKKQNKYVESSIKNALLKDSWRNIPIYIICRDRYDELVRLLSWLEKMGMKNIILIDNDSIYPPLVNYYSETNYQVIRTQSNVGHTVPWTGGIIRTLSPNELYIVTDPDIIPDINCPDDVIEHFLTIHLTYFAHQKVGFGLLINDLPNKYHLKQSVIDWESQFWKVELERDVYEAGVDTTFALYKPFVHRYIIHPAIRTGGAYVARHAPWYCDSTKLTPEDKFYRARVNSQVTSWNVDEVAERYKVELKRMKK